MKTLFYTDRILAKVDELAVKPLVTALGMEYTNEVKRLMRNSPATGRLYPKRRGRGQHRASAPGEPPAPDTGQLIQSIRARVVRTPTGWAAECGSTLKKALYLEFGAARVPPKGGRVNPSRPRQPIWILFPRPAWGPALKAIRRQVPEIMRDLRRRGRI